MWIFSLFTLILLILLSVFFGSISMFIENNADFYTILQFMTLSIPQMMYFVLPFSVCLGILSAQAVFSRHVEIIAMQACSVSTARIFMPFIAVGLLSTFIMICLSFYIYPISQKNADKIEHVYIKKKDIQGTFTVTGGRFKVGSDIYYVEHLDISKGIMHNISYYQIISGKLHSIVKATNANWDGKAWASKDIKTTTFDDKGITTTEGISTLAIGIGPADLVVAQPRPEALTIYEMKQYLDQLKTDGIRSPHLETSYYGRYSFALAPFIMTILVLPFGMRFPRAGGIARGIAYGLVLGLSYWSLYSGMITLGASGFLPPVFASWIANVLALLTGLTLLYKRSGSYG